MPAWTVVGSSRTESCYRRADGLRARRDDECPLAAGDACGDEQSETDAYSEPPPSDHPVAPFPDGTRVLSLDSVADPDGPSRAGRPPEAFVTRFASDRLTRG